MKKIVACVAASLALLASGSGWAQANPESEKAVKELLVAMKYREMMTASMKQMSKNMPNFMMQAVSEALSKNTKLTAEQKKAALTKAEKDTVQATAAVDAVFADPKLMDELEKEMVPLYAKYFKAEEIRQITTFYKTPVGSKLLTTFPQIMGEASAIAQKIVMPRVAKQVDKFAADHAN